MIQSKKDLKEYIAADNNWLLPKSGKEKIIGAIAKYPHREFKRFLKYLRLQEYYLNTANGSKWKGFMALVYEGKKNKLGLKLGVEIGPNVFGKGLNMYHAGNIVINPAVRVGENCGLRGGNCIGNNGFSQEVPVLGDNVELGFGAVVFGGITIANGVKIAANAVVNKSVLEENCVVAGVPAKIVKHAEK